jgi:hypothetical protein
LHECWGYPYLWDVGYAGTEGKRVVIKEKERQREEAFRKEHPDLV